VIFAVALVTLVSLAACGPGTPGIVSGPGLLSEETPAQTVKTPSGAYLTPNPVETSMPIYGGTLEYGYWIPRSFDAHQKVGYGPTAALPVFNQLVMFNIDFKDVVPENIIGDLAESWETSPDGLSITFKLRQGVKWQDGLPFTSDDVVYSLDKMTDVNRSVIYEWFAAYERTEKIDEYAVKVHLKYPSAGFMISLAQGESVIQAWHLAGTDPQSADFMVGTGPFLLTEYKPGVHLKYQRNPDYWKKDKYGNQLPYLDGMTMYQMGASTADDLLISRRLDFIGPPHGVGVKSRIEYLKQGAPELLWQKRERITGSVIFINTKHKPLDDMRVRRALGMILDEQDLILGYAGDSSLGITDVGLLHPSFGLPKEEVLKLMGWDKPYEARVSEAQQLMAEAGYQNGFKMNMMSTETTEGRAGATLVFAEALRQHLKINVEVNVGLGSIELNKRLTEDNYDTYTYTLDVPDPVQLKVFFATGGYSNWSKYSNTNLDKMLAEVDSFLDPDKRREAIMEIERILLTDLPALPTGCFPPAMMPYYPHIKNLRWMPLLYSNINRLEDVWIDESLRVK
jgi:peptide/nickel transport system substrate-binding protein